MKDLKRKPSYEMEASEPMKKEGPRYPYGMQITFEIQDIEKFPILKNCKVGDAYEIKAMGKVVSMNISDNERSKRKDLSIQLEKMEVLKPSRTVKVGEGMEFNKSEEEY